MVVMFGAMALMRRVDQEDPQVLLYARAAFAVYITLTLLVHAFLHMKIVRRADLTLINVPIVEQKPPFAMPKEEKEEGAEPLPAADKDEEEKKPKEEVMTVLEYDLGVLASARKSWISNAIILSLFHYKMESVSPLIMSGVMGLVRLLSDDPLFKLHVLNLPSVGVLQRPFAPEKNPLAAMLKEMAPKPEAETDGHSRPAGAPADANDLHDDGESDDDEDPPAGIAALSDDHVKSDFEEDDLDASAEGTEPKKSK